MTLTIQEALTDAKKRITPVSFSVSLDAQLLLAEVLQVSRAHVIAHREKVLTPEQATHYESLIARRENGEPVAYLLARRAFYDREFIVSPAVLIPRPETEHLLEIALDYVKTHPQAVVVDVGTGSGALAVTLAANTPQTTVYAVDISPDALHIARMNAEAQHTNVTFLEGSLLAPLIEQGIKVDLIMANLPYIPTEEMHNLAVSQHEPHLALDGGADGLDLIRELLDQIPDVCQPGALILLEIGADQATATRALIGDQLSDAQVTVQKDYAGHDRVVAITFTD